MGNGTAAIALGIFLGSRFGVSDLGVGWFVDSHLLHRYG